MRHFIGGLAVGWIVGLCFAQAGKDKPMVCIVLGFLSGIAAWGLLP